MIKRFLSQKIIVILFFTVAIAYLLQWSVAQTQNLEINLIHEKLKWQPYSAAIVSQNETDLYMIAVTDLNDTLWNRVYLPIQLNSTSNSSVLLDLNYSTISNSGNATYFSEVRDNSSNKVLWSNFLNNTNGRFVDQNFTLPSNIKNKPIEFRFYIVTNNVGEHALDIKRAILTVP